MNLTHFHLLSTHLPIFGTLIGIGILAYGQIFKKTEIQKVALVLFVLMALVTVPVFLSGEEAEETAEHLAAVSEQSIENHEELAEKAIWLMYSLGALALINLLILKRQANVAKTFTIFTLVIAMVTFGLFARVGYLGGKIRHTEVSAASDNTGNEYNNEHRNHESDDDD